MRTPPLAFPKEIWTHLIRPYWTSSERWRAYGLLGGYLTLMAGFIALTVRLNYWNNDFFSALQNLDMNAFLSLLLVFCGLAFLSIMFFTFKHYLLKNLEIRWRQWMTDYFLQKWMENRRYYALQVEGHQTDNPDQRIAEDIQSFIRLTLSLYIGLLQNFIFLLFFLNILWTLSGTLRVPLGSMVFPIPGYMCWGAFLFALFGTACSFYVGKGLTKLNYDHEKTEANFRYSLVRFRDNMEGVALYQGEALEQIILKERFKAITENIYATLRKMLAMNTWLSFYSQIQPLIPLLLAAPLFFTKVITFGILMQARAAFQHVSHAFSFIVENYADLTFWKATTTRLLEFNKLLSEGRRPGLTPTVHAKEAIEISCDSLQLPHGGILKANLHFTVEKGIHTLISGPTGTGKTILARAIAGLWPYGQGEIRLPSSPLFFLPQKPYLPLGSLKEILQYPGLEVSLEELCQGLDEVGLPTFKSRLGEVNEWSRILSLGEQQRIAILRVLLKKPLWIVLDEATSGMDERAESHLYQLLKQWLPQATLISIGHRESLRGFHSQEINLERTDHDFVYRLAV